MLIFFAQAIFVTTHNYKINAIFNEFSFSLKAYRYPPPPTIPTTTVGSGAVAGAVQPGRQRYTLHNSDNTYKPMGGFKLGRGWC